MGSSTSLSGTSSTAECSASTAAARTCRGGRRACVLLGVPVRPAADRRAALPARRTFQLPMSRRSSITCCGTQPKATAILSCLAWLSAAWLFWEWARRPALVPRAFPRPPATVQAR